MTKDEFMKTVDAPASLAEQAWKLSDGNESRARELLEVNSVWVKGEFTSSSDPVRGYFLVGFDLENHTPDRIDALVVNTDSEQDLNPSMDLDSFSRELETMAKSQKKMNANSEQLNDTLSSAWKESQSEVIEAVIEGQPQKLGDLHKSLFSETFDFSIADTTVETDKRRAIHEEDASDPTGGETTDEEETELPCDVEITPTRGVPVAALSPGDKIFVEIGSVDRGDKNVKRRLEATKDQETGLVPAQLVSKQTSDAGTMNLRVQFAENVYGNASCGKDVSLRVPDSTYQSYQDRGSGTSGDPLQFLMDNWVISATGIVVVILLIGLAVVISGAL